jgi:hypothetical protein
LEGLLAEDATLNSRQLVGRLQEERGVRVHPRSIERALERRSKKGPGPGRRR